MRKYDPAVNELSNNDPVANELSSNDSVVNELRRVTNWLKVIENEKLPIK